MKYSQATLLSCLFLGLTCSAAEQSSLTNVALPKKIGLVSAIAYPHKDYMLVGGAGGCVRVCLNSKNNPSIFVNDDEVFSIDAHKKKCLCVIASRQGLSIYSPAAHQTSWRKNDLPTKNMSVAFAAKNTILALDTDNQLLRQFNYKKNTAQQFQINCYKPEGIPTALLSHCINNTGRLFLAYINENLFACKKPLFGSIAPKTLPSDLPQHTKEALFSPDSNSIAIVNWSDGVVVWNSKSKKKNVSTLKPKYTIDDIMMTLSIAMSDDILAVLSHPGHAEYVLDFYNLKTGKFIAQKNKLPLDFSSRKDIMTYLRRLVFSPDKKSIAVLGDTNALLIPVPEEVIDQQDTKQ